MCNPIELCLSTETCITHTQLHYDDYMKLITDNDIELQRDDCGLLCSELIDRRENTIYLKMSDGLQRLLDV